MSMPFQKKECVVCVAFDDLDAFIQSKRSEEECRYGLHVERCGNGLDLFYYDEDDCEGKNPFSVIDGQDIIMRVLSKVIGFFPTEVAFNRDMVYLIK